VYRINKYQVALQGQVVETGVAFVITLDYNEFKVISKVKQLKSIENLTNSSLMNNNSTLYSFLYYCLCELQQEFTEGELLYGCQDKVEGNET
jgi:hypothetical protein